MQRGNRRRGGDSKDEFCAGCEASGWMIGYTIRNHVRAGERDKADKCKERTGY